MIRRGFGPLHKTTFLFSLLGFILFFTACTRLEQTRLGGDLIPGSDRLITDTILLPVSTTSFIELDTSFVSKTDPHLVGFVNDPMFGTTSASMFFQMLPVSYPFSLPVSKDSLFLDSLVLSLKFNGLNGDTAATTTVNVYRIQDPGFRPNRRYSVHEAPAFSVTEFLGSRTFTATQLRKGYKLAFRGDSIFNQLRIRLSDQLGRALLDQDNVTGAFRNDTLFKQFLNGLALLPDSTTSGNAVHYFSLTDFDSKLNLYYRARRTDGALDTSVAVFPFRPDTIRSANANKIHRNYNGSLALPTLASGLPASLAYVQTAPGTSVNIRVPALDTLRNKPYVIHRAELVARQIFQGPLAIENIFRPPVMHLYTQNANGQNAPIPFDSLNYFQISNYDFFRQTFLSTISIDYTGGIPSFFTDGSGNQVVEYRMNITRYVQNIATGRASRRDFKLAAPYLAEFSGGILSASSINPLSFGRVQLGGGTHPQYPMFVRIYYSKQ
ncbi:MAG TPA: DUF4270 family protein [Lacibacter sp.]|nr:DUF4270 family protein [Lacibacter sp.]HMO89799.1 DUF4270 family protein [Lacibacter sp.]